MSGPRPGSHQYDVQRTRLRDQVENTGEAPDDAADERANEILQQERDQKGMVRSERGLGPKGER